MAEAFDSPVFVGVRPVETSLRAFWRRVLKEFLVPLPLIDHQPLSNCFFFLQIPRLISEYNHHHVWSFYQAQDPSDGRI